MCDDKKLVSLVRLQEGSFNCITGVTKKFCREDKMGGGERGNVLHLHLKKTFDFPRITDHQETIYCA